MNIPELQWKHAIITGGANGLIGPIIASMLLNELGMKIHCIDLPKYNLYRFEDIESFVNSLTDCPTILIHNAAIDPKPGADDGTNPFRRHEEIMKVNHIAVARLNELLIPRMIDNGGGIIIIIGSIMGYIAANMENYKDGWLKAFGYNESKAALQAHCRNINVVFGRYGIRCVMPSFGPYYQGLSPEFMEGFGKKIPMQHPVSKGDLISTIKYCIECESLASDFKVDGGYLGCGR